MSAKLGIFIIHGMGKQDEHFADELIGNLRKRLSDDANALVEFQPCYWANILQQYQDETWNKLKKSPMDWQDLRSFVVSWLGDAINYLIGYYKPSQRAYSEIHECVCTELTKLENKIEPGAPLMVLAHSLGSVIMSNYIWDAQHRDPKNEVLPQTPFQRTETLTSLITYGSNIPLFLPPQKKIECIGFPWQSLPEKYKGIAQWINIYDKDDVLGYPLKDIWTDAHGTVITDKVMNIGPLLISETPLSHAHYQNDNDFLNIVIEQINLILAVKNESNS